MKNLRPIKNTLLFNKINILYLFFFFLPLIYIPGFYDAYTVPKWILLHLTAVILVSCYFLKDRFSIQFPKLTKVFFFNLAILIFFEMINKFKFNQFFEESTLSAVTFFVFIIFFYNYFLNKKVYEDYRSLFMTFILSGLGISLWGIFQKIHLGPEVSHLGHLYSAGFGNINMSGQFVALSLLMFIFVFSKLKDNKKRLLALTAGIPIFSYLLVTGCRSAFLGLAIATVIYFVIGLRRKNLYKYVVFFLSIVSFILILFIILEQYGLSVPVSKRTFLNATAIERIEVWNETIEMIKDSPLGIGTNNYTFSIIPYQMKGNIPPSRQNIFKSPHNDYLKIIAEDGIHYFTFLVLSIFLLLLLYIKNNRNLFELRWSISFLSFFLVEGFFQFPLELSTNRIFIALLLGFFLARTFRPLKVDFFSRKRSILFCLFYLIIFIPYTTSKVFESRFFVKKDYKEIACKMLPSNWHACYQYSRILIRDNDFVAAEKEVVKLLIRNRYNFPALDLWAHIVRKKGNLLERCGVQHILKKMFRSKSDDFLFKDCPVPTYAFYKSTVVQAKYPEFFTLGAHRPLAKF